MSDVIGAATSLISLALADQVLLTNLFLKFGSAMLVMQHLTDSTPIF